MSDDTIRTRAPDDFWQAAEPLIPVPAARPQGGGRRRADDRAVLAAIVYLVQAGCSWRKLPAALLASAGPRAPPGHPPPPPVPGRRGRPRHRPDKLHADKAYDQRPLRAEISRRGIAVRIARKGVETSQKLGRHRWIAEPAS